MNVDILPDWLSSPGTHQFETAKWDSQFYCCIDGDAHAVHATFGCSIFRCPEYLTLLSVYIDIQDIRITSSNATQKRLCNGRIPIVWKEHYGLLHRTNHCYKRTLPIILTD